MTTLFRIFALLLAAIGLIGLSACGSDDESDSSTTVDENSDSENTVDGDDDDHDDEDKDHDDDEDKEGHDHDDHDDNKEKSSGLDAHEHGVAELLVGWDEGEMVIDLISPAINIYGFENEPTTEEEIALVSESDETLAGSEIMAVNAEAGCELSEDVEPELEVEGSHAEITASWLFDCENPDAISELDIAALFDAFPNLEDVDAQWASPTGQSSDELTSSSAVLTFE